MHIWIARLFAFLLVFGPGGEPVRAEIKLPEFEFPPLPDISKLPKLPPLEFTFTEATSARGERIIIVTPTSGQHSHFRLVPKIKEEWKRLHPGEIADDCHYSDWLKRIVRCAVYTESPRR